MSVKEYHWRGALTDRFFLLGLLMSLAYWLIESSVHPFFFGEGTFISQVFHPGAHELWMRAVVVCVILLFSVYVGAVVARMRRSRDELIDERNRARKYLDVVGVMVVGLDSQGRVSIVNRKGCEVLGYPEEEILGRDWFEDFIPDKMRAEMKGFFDRVISGEMEAGAYYENPVVTRGGQEKLVAWDNTVLRDADGLVVSTLSSGVDITERRRAEVVLAERLDELERFRKATVERELRIKELKDRLSALPTA